MQYYNLAVADEITDTVLRYLSSFPKSQLQITKIDKPQNAISKIDTTQRQAGILSGFTADPAFYEPLDKL